MTKIAASDFGTCNLTLYGVRSRSYSLSILALGFLEASLHPQRDAWAFQPFYDHLGIFFLSWLMLFLRCGLNRSLPFKESGFPKFQIQQREYEASMVRSTSLTHLLLEVTLGLDSNIMLETQASSCNATQCQQESVQPLPKAGRNGMMYSRFAVPRQAMDGVTTETNLSNFSNLSLQLVLSPKSQSFGSLSCTYTFVVVVFDLVEKLAELSSEISTQQGELASSEEFQVGNSSAVRHRLLQLTQQRNHLLEQAYTAQATDSRYASLGELTFLAVGLTGTGKSELCRWMTGNQKRCVASRSTVSHTDEVGLGQHCKLQMAP